MASLQEYWESMGVVHNPNGWCPVCDFSHYYIAVDFGYAQ